jgi:hypothetical protein
METEQIITKLKNFLENKCKLENKDCYFITKKLNEEYWENILDEGEQESIDDFDDLDNEDYDEEEDQEETKPSRVIKPIPMPKKPKIDEEFED